MATPTLQIACPHCAARLRLRDRSFVGRTIDCPDCRQSLTIQLTPNGEFVGAPAGAQPLSPAFPRRAPATATIVAWAIALAACAALVVWVIRRTPQLPEPVAAPPAAVAPPATAPPEQPPEPVVAAPAHEPETATPIVPATVTPAEPAPPAAPQPAPPAAGPEADPIEVALAPDAPAFDLAAALDQPLAEFRQPTPIPAGELLKLIGELAGVAVDTTQLSAAAASQLDQPVTLDLSATTVRGILDATVDAAGLTYSLGEGRIVVTAAPPR